MFIITLERHLTSRISPVPYPHCTRAYRGDVLSKYHTRTARRLSVLRSVLSSIIMENGPLLQRAITGLVASTAKHLFTIIVIFVRRHLKDFTMAEGKLCSAMKQANITSAEVVESGVWVLGLKKAVNGA